VRALLLGTPGRLVTLTGTGGCGKTQLALGVAWDLAEDFRDGVWFVSLAPVKDATLIVPNIAAALDCRERLGEPLQRTLLDFLADRQMLMVLDNCEHQVEACARLAEQILDECPGVRLLATSRERLRISGESTWRVPSLAVPNSATYLSPTDLLKYPSVRLFVERVQAIEPAFQLEPQNAAAVVGICSRLEGLPLAIELAAARASALTPQQIVVRLEECFRLLVSGSRTAPSRQQTLGATLDWSHGLLSEGEVKLFRRLPVFAGGWSLEGAEAVCAEDGLPASEIVDLTARLVDQSLVEVESHAGTSRYRLLEPVRQYALTQLRAAREHAAIQRRHAEYFLSFSEGLQYEANVGGARRMAAQERLAEEQSNIRVALRWCIDHAEADMGLRLAEAQTGLWIVRNLNAEGLAWLRQVLAIPGAEARTKARAAALIHAGFLAMREADYVQARTWLEEALPITREAGDAWLRFCNFCDLARNHRDRGEYATARGYFMEALATVREAGDRVSESHVCNNLGFLAALECDFPLACDWARHGLAIARTLNDAWSLAMSLHALGGALVDRGMLTEAGPISEEGLALHLQTSDRWGASYSLHDLGRLALAEGRLADAQRYFTQCLTYRYELNDQGTLAAAVAMMAAHAAVQGERGRALMLAGASAAMHERVGVAISPREQGWLDRWLPGLRELATDDEARAAYSTGREMSTSEAVTLALDVPGPAVPAEVEGPLTPRQLEVAILVAQGKTNRQIAEHLVVTERTVGAHVEHILHTLGLAKRTQVAVWVAEHGLLASSA